MREYCASLLKVCVVLDLILWRIVLQGCFCIHLKLKVFKFDIEDWEDADWKPSAGDKEILDWHFNLFPKIKILFQ